VAVCRHSAVSSGGLSGGGKAEGPGWTLPPAALGLALGGMKRHANAGLAATLVLLFGPLLASGAPGTLKVAICSEGYAPLIMRSLDGSYYGFEVDQVRLDMDVCVRAKSFRQT
jgi:hypothetical protein